MPHTTIVVLKRHRRKLAEAKTWEEYRDAHVRFLDFLIAKYEAEDEVDRTAAQYLEDTE